MIWRQAIIILHVIIYYLKHEKLISSKKLTDGDQYMLRISNSSAKILELIKKKVTGYMAYQPVRLETDKPMSTELGLRTIKVTCKVENGTR